MTPDLSQPQTRLGDFNWRKFGHEVSVACRRDGRAQAVIADEIGVTESDLSRARGGNIVSAPKVIAIAEWLGRSLLDWYVPPRGKSTSCTESNVKHFDASRDAPEPAAPVPAAARGTGRDGRSALPASPEAHDDRKGGAA